MKAAAAGLSEGLRSYLSALDAPAYILDPSASFERSLEEARQVLWRNAAALNYEVDAEDRHTLSQLQLEASQRAKPASAHSSLWEVSLLEEWTVVRRLGTPTPSSSSNGPSASDSAAVSLPSAPASHAASKPGRRKRDLLDELAQKDPHANLVYSFDWSSTSLGPIEHWEAAARSAVFTTLTCPWPTCVCLCAEFPLIYNKSYAIDIMGSKHPDKLGFKTRDVWPEVWHYIEGPCRQLLTTGEPVGQDDAQYFVQSHTSSDEVQELRISWAYVPFLNASGQPGGFFNTVMDKTPAFLAERRGRALRQLREGIGAARNPADVFKAAITALDEFCFDVPFLAIYAVEDVAALLDDAPTKPIPNDASVRLSRKQTLGLTEAGIKHLPEVFEVALGDNQANGAEESPWPFAKCFASDFASVQVPQQMHDDAAFEKRGWHEDALRLAAVAASSQSHGLPRVLIVAGLDTRQPMTEDYRQFLLAVTRFIDTGIMAALESEAERKQRQTLERLVKQRTEELANSQMRFKSLCDFAPTGVLECSQDGQITYVNSAWRRMTAISTALPLDYDCFLTAVVKTQADELKSQWEQAIKKQKSSQLQWQWKHGGFVFSETFPLPSGQTMSVWTDISAHLAYSEKLVDRQRARAEEAESAQRLQENFISLVQHETRNPINAILQGTDVVFSCLKNLGALRAAVRDIASRSMNGAEAQTALLDVGRIALNAGDDLQEVNETVEAIAIAARHQAKIAADLLSQSKMQSGLLTLTPIDFVLLNEVENILKLFAAQARLAHITTSVKHDESINELTVVRADPTRFTQIVVNLISNSMRFLECWKGKRKLEVEIALHRQRPKLKRSSSSDSSKTSSRSSKTKSPLLELQEHKQYLLCKVHDTGPGLTPDQQGKLFTRFNDVAHNAEANRRRGGGTGLGLYLSRQLANLQGGEIAAESDVGEGSVFAFFIQIEMGRRDRLEAEHDIRRLDQSAPSPVSPQPWPAVLVVEDNSISQKLMRRQLETRGYRVKTANNGFDALAIMCSDEPLLAGLLDVEMPVKDGIETSEELRDFEEQHGRKHKLPLCAVTGNTSEVQMQRIRAAGVDFVLSKPYQISDLVNFLQQAGQDWVNRKEQQHQK